MSKFISRSLKISVFISTITILLSLSACQKSDTPKAVSEKFWAAIQANDIATAQTLAMPGSLDKHNLNLSGATLETLVSEGVIKNNLATVKTHHKGSHKGITLDYQFNTALVLMDDEWKVDVNKTAQSLVPAAMSATFSDLGNALNDSFSNLSNAFGHEAQAIGSLIGQVLDQSVEQMSQELENASTDLSASAQQISSASIQAAAQYSQQLSQELTQELKNANELYQQKYQQQVQALKDAATLPPAEVKPSSNSHAASVTGTIAGTDVQLTQASAEQALAFYSGDNWSENPSLLLFTFIDNNDALASQTINIGPDDSGSLNPHIHLRWINAESGKIETKIVSKNYRLSLQTSKADSAGNISGTLFFAEGSTQLSGSFTLQP